MSLHTMGAVFFKAPGLMLAPEEANALGEAIERVNALYDLPVLSEKTMAWLNLATVAGAIYGSRLVAASIAKKQRKDSPQAAAGQVVEFPQAPAPGVN